MTTPRIDQRITQICELGCTRVSEIIVVLEQGQTTLETADLRPVEQALVLRELQAIMAVYNSRKSSCTD